MLICRCAWHSRYYGHPLWNGIASWRGFGFGFTDGICPRCLQRFRDEHHRSIHRRKSATPTPQPERAA
jgi:hypothetical protein